MLFAAAIAWFMTKSRPKGAAESWYTYEIIDVLPHDPAAFTQGFIYDNGFFYEGTGLHGQSSLRRIIPRTGTIVEQIDLPADLFGEGIAIHDGKIIQLTWQENVALVYDLESLALTGTFPYPAPMQGWGLTCDGRHLIMSNGSATLFFLDPATFTAVKSLEVTSAQGPVADLNELEFIKGEIYANVWLTDRIVRIDPATGRVTGWIELAGLLDPSYLNGHPVDVLNGIAYDEAGDRIFVTGKLWPKVFEIALVPKEPRSRPTRDNKG